MSSIPQNKWVAHFLKISSTLTVQIPNYFPMTSTHQGLSLGANQRDFSNMYIPMERLTLSTKELLMTPCQSQMTNKRVATDY